jgi:hypothetical protein
MPSEIIGEVGTPGAERKWIAAQASLAIKHIKKTCGEPPPEMELELQWQEHELGSYPLIVLTWEDAMRGAPGVYLERCEDALFDFDYNEPLPGRETPASVLEWRDEDAPKDKPSKDGEDES